MIIRTEYHRYIDTDTGREYPSVTQTIKDAGLMGYMPGDEWYLDRGTAAHEATALFDSGTLDPESVDPAIQPYIDAWIQFRADTGFVPKRIEQIVYSEAGYAGTIDRDGLDIKAGVPMAWHILQAAAYWRAATPGGSWKSVYLSNDGRYKIVVYTAAQLMRAYRVFVAALEINEWKKENRV